MSLTETQFQALKEQLRKRKNELGDDAYNEFVSGSQKEVSTSTPAPSSTSTATFPSTGQETPLQAGIKSAGNVPKSGFTFLKNIATAVTNPIETTSGIFNAVTGLGREIQKQVQKGAEKVGLGEVFRMGENERADETFSALKQSIVDRYGSLENAERTAIEDPVGVGADIVGILAGTKVFSNIDDINTLAKESITQKASKTFNNIAVGEMQKAINLNPSDIRKIKQPNIAGKDPANWLLERGFQGSQEQIVTQLDNHRYSSKLQVDEGLKAIETSIPASEAGPARNTIQVLKNTFEGTVGNETLVKTLDDLLQKESYTLSELNDIKRLADSELNIFKSTGVLKESATAKGLFNVRDELKTLIENKASENGFNSVKELNKETQVAREISDAMKKRLDVENKLPELGLTDFIVAGGGLASGNILPAVGVIVGKQIIQSPKFKTFMANRLKQATPQEVANINDAILSGDRVRLLTVLAPIVNEYQVFETDQKQNKELQE